MNYTYINAVTEETQQVTLEQVIGDLPNFIWHALYWEQDGKRHNVNINASSNDSSRFNIYYFLNDSEIEKLTNLDNRTVVSYITDLVVQHPELEISYEK